MRCSKAKKLISDYVDHSLQASQRTSLENHLRTCSGCQQVLRDIQGLVAEAKGLEKIFPSDRVWPHMKSKLQAREKVVLAPRIRPKLRYAFSAALILMVIVCGTYFGLRNWKGKAPLGNNNLQKYTLAKLEKAERHYQQAIKALTEAVTAQVSDFDPKLSEVFQTNLKIIDKSIQACEQAVAGEPDNIEVRNYLLAMYQQKVDFLREMVEMSRKISLKEKLKTTL